MNWLSMVANRLLWFVPTLVGLLAIVFVLSRVIPVDPRFWPRGEFLARAGAAGARAVRVRQAIAGAVRELPARHCAGQSRCQPLHPAAHHRRPEIAPARHAGANHLRGPDRGFHRHPPRGPLRPAPQLVDRSRASDRDGFGPGGGVLLAGDAVPVPVLDEARVAAAVRSHRGISAGDGDGAHAGRCDDRGR